MKIDSTDATSLQIKNVRDSGARTNTVKPGAETMTKRRGLKDINIPLSQLSDYEREEFSISEKAFIEAIERANKALTGANTQFEFSIHDKTKEIMVKVIDTNTREIIREIPPEKILDMVATMLEMAGIIVDERR
ncbi:MAG: flagellar protein FlaG [Clostridium sp.]|nr:flagellar protein FlaG [Clostridium sp.]